MPSWTQGSVSSITLLTLTVQSVDTNTLITFYCYFTTCSTATQVGSWIQFTQQHCNNVYGSHSCIWSRARPIYWHFSLPVLSCMYVAYCTHFLYTKRLRFDIKTGQNTERLWMVRVCITRTWTISSESLSSRVDSTRDTETPSWRWTPAHSMQTNTPIFTTAQSGPVEGKDRHD